MRIKDEALTDTFQLSTSLDVGLVSFTFICGRKKLIFKFYGLIASPN